MNPEKVRRGDEFAFHNILMRYPNARFFDDERGRKIFEKRTSDKFGEYEGSLEWATPKVKTPTLEQYKRNYNQSTGFFNTCYSLIDPSKKLKYGMVALDSLVDERDILLQNIWRLQFSRTVFSGKVSLELQVMLNRKCRSNQQFFDKNPYSGGVVLVGQRSGAVFGRDGTRLEIPLAQALDYCGLDDYSLSAGADAVRFMRQAKEGPYLKYEAKIDKNMCGDPLSALLGKYRRLMPNYFHVGLDNDPLPS